MRYTDGVFTKKVGTGIGVPSRKADSRRSRSGGSVRKSVSEGPLV